MQIKIQGTAHIHGFDWGPMVTHLIVDVGMPIPRQTDLKSLLMVDVKKGSWLAPSRTTSIVLVDFLGNEVSEDSSFIRIDFEIHPYFSQLNPFEWNGDKSINEWAKHFWFVIKLRKPLMIGTKKITSMKLSGFTKDFHGIENVSFHTYQGSKTRFHYALYSPSDINSPRPVIIWLHGAGEGGRDPLLALYGNRVTQLMTPAIQGIFGGAYVLVPQTPTIWMDNGTGDYTTDGYSRYTKDLNALIHSVLKNLSNVDDKRIYIGGCSNGGFMTLKMMLENPSLYAAAFPICEAYQTTWLTKKEIQTLATIPSWYVVTRNDSIVPPATHAQSLTRKIKTKTKQVIYTRLPYVGDRFNRYHNDEGKIIRYHPHWSWVPVLNNEVTTMVNDLPVSLMEWLSSHKKEV